MPLKTMPVEEVRQRITQDQHDDTEIVYPESDGEPMGETEYHVIATLYLYDALRHYFRHDPNIYVAADMFLYYEEGNPRANKSPDVMVIKGVEKRRRRIFKIWEEQAVPTVIFEVSSKSTIIEDLMNKSFLYASLGVSEYFLFDPLKEYIETSLIGFRLKDGEYVQILPDEKGYLFSQELEIFLVAGDDLLRIIDPHTHQPVPGLDEAITKAEQEARRAEQETQHAEQEAQRAEQEAQRAEQERQRAEAAEAELARLRARLKDQ